MSAVLPKKSIKINIEQNEYEVRFPLTGQFIDIQALKAQLSNQYYSTLSASNDFNDSYAVMLIDAIATFQILIPELKKDLNYSSILGLDMIHSRILVDAYLDYYLPFYNEWMNVISAKKAPEIDGKSGKEING